MMLHAKPTRLHSTLLALLALVMASTCASCAARQESVEPESIRLGSVLLEPSLPVFVAEDQKLFAKNALDVEIKYYDIGLRAAGGVANGEVDLSTPVAEYVLAGKVFAGEDIQAIASVGEVDYSFVVARKDHGIETVSDLKGKRIGVVRGTILEFQLGRFLDLSGLSIADVTLVSGTLPQSAESVINGDVDAAMMIPPVLGTVQRELGDKAAYWPAQNDQPFFSLVLGQKEWIAENPDLVERFLRAMSDAEDFIADHPAEAKAILKKRLEFSDAEVERAWSHNDFSLSLDQALILALEDQARWMIENKLTTATAVPDFLTYVHADGLDRVKPGAVSIIR